MTTSFIKPGILVSLKSTVSGGISYNRRDLAAETTENGSHRSKWETECVVEDPAEHERATKVRGKALGLIRAVCSPTAFGLLCPLENEGKLDDAVKQARALIAEYRTTAAHTDVTVFCLKGRIASTDEEAARAIGDEVSSLIQSMNGAIDRLDADAIREAANKARAMSAMLSEERAEKVNGAIEQARKAARDIVRRVTKGGEKAAIVLADIQRGAIESARIAFLDIDTPEGVTGEALPAVEVQRVAELDVEEEPSEPSGRTGCPACDGQGCDRCIPDEFPAGGEGEVLAAEAAQS